MSKDLGKRTRKPVIREGFIEEEEFDRILMDEYGVTEDELREDIERSGMTGGFNISQADIQLPDGKKVTLYAEGDGDSLIFNYLEGLTPEEVFALWENMDNRKAIGSLIRYPGEWHEWLMVAALPFLKEMGIPLVWMTEFRTLTCQCLFHYIDKEKQEQTGFHGGPGSGLMHINLLKCYTDAHKKLSQGQCEPGPSAGRVIAENLIRFAEQHYKERSEIPEGLVGLINKLTEVN